MHREGGKVIFDYFDDKLLKRRGRMDMLEVKRCARFAVNYFIYFVLEQSP